MSPDEAFERLCGLYGVEAAYDDIWGVRHRVSVETRRALLRAMGVLADDDAAVLLALDAHEAGQWKRWLPPVLVVREQASPIAIPVSVPLGVAAERFEWTLSCEDGRRFEGWLCPADGREEVRHTLACGVFVRHVFELRESPGLGYHRFELRRPATAASGADASMSLIVAPATCYRPAVLAAPDARAWGLSVQLYAVRSRRNWGHGDFGDLQALLALCAEHGAAALAVNPLYALFPERPECSGPYGASSRLFLNVLYLDVEAIDEFAECEPARHAVAATAFAARLHALQAATVLDYRAVAELKFAILELLYAHFRVHHLATGSARAAAFRAFQVRHGEALRRHALFEALQSHFHARDDAVWGWPAWPADHRDPQAAAVAAFCEANVEQVEFYAWLQWQAETQLAAAGQRSLHSGLGVGLLLDLPVGVDRGGSETWSEQTLYASGVGIGVPPDDFNLNGQDWGLVPFVPHLLHESGYLRFIEILRCAMREAGALRIDHVMGLQRLFWIPAGGAPCDGGYVRYPLDDLLAIVSLESRRNRCLVIGEDLGTVPDSVRAALGPAGVLSYRVLYFEKRAASFVAPVELPREAVVCVATHDLPTLAGFWQGADLVLRQQLGLYPTPEVGQAQQRRRAEDRVQLLAALLREGLLAPKAIARQEQSVQLATECAIAIHRFLARSPARLMIVQAEDLFAQCQQVNLPGTTGALHPNWRLRLPVELEAWPQQAAVAALFAAMREERPVAGV